MRIFVIAALLLGLGGCSDLCENTTIMSVVAPDGLHKAALFKRNCGTTVAFSTQVSITFANENSFGAGNVFRADDNNGAASAGAWGGPWSAIKWLDADHLIVEYDVKSRIFERATNVAGVRVTYRAISR